uniref:DUF4817 domain-containing protein n=1 Tax=Strongyloides papillosus TaxID=174720 RepID=A0A0N5B4A2_STREA
MICTDNYKLFLLFLTLYAISAQKFKYSQFERTIVVECYYVNNLSIILTQKCYKKYFKTRNAPTRQTIRNIVKRFNKHGSVSDVNRPGRPRTMSSTENIEKIKQNVLVDGNISLRKRAQQLCMAKSTLHDVMKHKIKFFPYKPQTAHELLPVDKNQRIDYAEKIKELIEKDCNFIDKLIMSDEANFYLNGFVNKQNYRQWSLKNPRKIINKKMKSKKVTVWCGITSKKIIGPYFFEDKKGKSLMINEKRYREMLEKFLVPELAAFPKDTWFQQDGAPSHTAAKTIELLKKIFNNRVISRNSPVNWPSRSPDLTTPDFFYGVILKIVYIKIILKH